MFARWNDQKVISLHKSNEVYIYRTCKITGLIFGVTAKETALKKWHSGMAAQDAFPELGSDEREFLISNTTPDEWEAMCWEDEDEDDFT